MRRPASLLLRVGMMGAVLWAGPCWLWSQGGSVARQGTSSRTEPFAEFDNSLTKAADLLLVAVIQTPTQIVSAREEKLSPARLDLQMVQPLWSGGEHASGAATERLNLLRPAVEPILRNRGVPVELAAVIAVESGGRTDALSAKGARGLWQLMPDTARRYGLRVDDIRDDRLDLFKATDAAARYLHDLFMQFGDWKLALAAYNTGEGNLGSAILRAHTGDFDQLTNLRVLPLETRNYVPRVLATSQRLGHVSPRVTSVGIVEANGLITK